jgi:hypothetical protein
MGKKIVPFIALDWTREYTKLVRSLGGLRKGEAVIAQRGKPGLTALRIQKLSQTEIETARRMIQETAREK